ncbi:prolipoprotein diacylglyceryl transferase [bacterium]|nr:prolipoprotein diacylglyceryl transferase [bacterium]MBP5591885.1 prolipoprotein diacylglyceryl transferase [bacterium]
MINWMSGGVINIASYITPEIFVLAVLIWFFMVKKSTDIRKNRGILVKTGLVSIAGAAIAPLFIVLVSGNLFPFLSSSWKVIQKINSFSSLRSIFKGFSITGGIFILSVVILFVLKDAKKLTFAILWPFPLFAALTRINCFLEGCCFGKLYNGIFAITYPPASIVSKQQYMKRLLPSRYVESLPVHPVQLYIIVSMLLLFCAVLVMKKLNVKKNIIAGTVLSVYGLSNFMIEFLREEPLVFKLVTMGQIMEFILFVTGLYLVFKVKEEEISEKEF